MGCYPTSRDFFWRFAPAAAPYKYWEVRSWGMTAGGPPSPPSGYGAASRRRGDWAEDGGQSPFDALRLLRVRLCRRRRTGDGGPGKGVATRLGAWTAAVWAELRYFSGKVGWEGDLGSFGAVWRVLFQSGSITSRCGTITSVC